jgi:hypothetical protein
VAKVGLKSVCSGRKSETGDWFRFLGAKFGTLKTDAVKD